MRQGCRSACLLVLPFAIGASISAQPVLLNHEASLTTYLPGGATGIQDIIPRYSQRATELDGTPARGRPTAFSPAANEHERYTWHTWREDASGVDFATGSLNLRELDLSLSAASNGVWSIARSYNSAQGTAVSPHDSAGYQGNNWFQEFQPEIILHTASEPEDDMLYLVHGADRYSEYRRVSGESDVYRGVNGTAGVAHFVEVENAPDTWTIYDIDGVRWVFFGFDDDAQPAAGSLWKRIGTDGLVSYIGDDSDAGDAITNGFDSAGRPTTAFDASGRRFDLTYTSGLLTSVDVLADAGSGYQSLGASITYTYYDGTDAHGSAGDLRSVTVSLPLSESGVSDSRTTLYRYWKGVHSGTNPGEAHLIRLVVGPEGFRAADMTDDGSLNGSAYSLSTDTLKPYAQVYFEYDEDRRVVSLFTRGACGCSGAADAVLTITYEANSSFSGTSAYDQTWASRAVIARPDGSHVTQYFDECGQPLSRVFSDIDPNAETVDPQFWVDRILRDTDGRVIEHHTPEANDSYTHTTGVIASLASSGLVHTYERLTSSDSEGFVEFECYQTGEGGDPYAERKFAYDTATLSVSASSYSKPRRTALREYIVNDVGVAARNTATNYVETTYSHTMWTGAAALRHKSLVTTLPPVSTSHNGSGSSLTTATYLRTDGTAAFARAADGTHDYTKFLAGLPVANVRDVDLTDTTVIASADDPSTVFGITTNSDGLHLVTQRVFDEFGRQVSETSPDDHTSLIHLTALADGRIVRLTSPLVQQTETTLYHGPVTYEVLLHNGSLAASALIGFSNSTTSLDPSDWTDENDADPITALLTGELSQVRYNVRDLSGSRILVAFDYTDVPATGPGIPGTHFDATFFHHDAFGRVVRTLTPDGTIERTTYDIRGRVAEKSVGTNDAGEPGGSISGTNNMTTTQADEYDSGGVGNSLLTQATRSPDSSTDRVTTYAYDHRNRPTLIVNPAAPHTVLARDGLGRVTAAALYSSSSGLTASTNPTSTTTNRVALRALQFDALGRPWRETRHAIASNGSSTDSLDFDYWYDDAGRLIKSQADSFQKWTYDRSGREISASRLARSDDSTYTHAFGTAGDHVMEERHLSYESSSERDPALIINVARHHDDLANGTTGPLYAFGTQGRLKFVAANAEGRATVSATWYDDLHRPVADAFYGDNGGSDFDRANLAAPTGSSGSQLVTLSSYDKFGRKETHTNENGIAERTLYDDAGRTIAIISNYVDGTPSGTSSADDIASRLAYSSGRVVSAWQDLDNDGTIDTGEPLTQYEYAVAFSTSVGGSQVTTNSLVSKVLLPGSTGASDSISFGYNALGELISRTDQAGTVLVFEYDAEGRLLHERATTVASGLEDDVRRITRSFDSAGRLNKVTQYDNASTSSGAVLDEVEALYNNWGILQHIRQDHDSVASGGSGVSPYVVSFVVAKSTGPRKTIRRTSMSLPSGDSVSYSYLSTANRLDADLSRVTRTRLNNVTLAEYKYLGESLRAETLLSEPNVFSNIGTSPGYDSLDRFGRIIDHTWTKDLTTDVDFVSFQYTFGSSAGNASSLLRVEDSVHGSFDQTFTNDAIDRLTAAERGDWTGSAISPLRDAEGWAFSPASNTTGYTLDADGDGAPDDAGDIDEARAFSVADELATRTSSKGDPLVSLSHSASGFLEDDGADYECVYDAWGRLRELHAQGGTPIAYFRYNGQHQRITRQHDADGDTTIESHEVYHEVYDDAWQIVATYRSTDSAPKSQYVYHPHPMGDVADATDLLIIRDRDANAGWTAQSDGTLEERRYYTHDALGSTACILTSGGYQVEHFRAGAYGRAFALPAGDTDSDGDWDQDDEDAITGAYDVRKDANLDGLITAADVTQADAVAGGHHTLGDGVQTSPAVANPFTWSGYEADPTVPFLYHVRYRVYDSRTQRWLTPDPIGYDGGQNLYEYAASSPTVAKDRLGLTWSVCLKWQPERVAGIFSDGWPLPPPNVVKGFESELRHKTHWFAGSDWLEVVSDATVYTGSTPLGWLFSEQKIARRSVCFWCDEQGQIHHKFKSNKNHNTGRLTVNAYINLFYYLSPAGVSGISTDSWGDAAFTRKKAFPAWPTPIRIGKHLITPTTVAITSVSPIRSHSWECQCCKVEFSNGAIYDNCRD